MSGILPTQGHQAPPNQAAAPTERIPMIVRDLAPGLRASVGSTIAATVTGVDSQGHLLLRTDRGVLALVTQLRPPLGSDVLVQLRPGSGAQLQAYIIQVREPGGAQSLQPTNAQGAAAAHGGHAPIPPPGPLTDAAALSRIWPSLEQVMRLLGHGAESAPLLPTPGPAFLHGLSTFLGALLMGDARQWLGAEAVRRLLQNGQGDALQRLERDFAQVQGLARDAGNDFRLFVLPFPHHEAALPLRLFVRREEEPTGGTSGQSHRFIAEAEFPQLGQIQIDGLAGDRRLDMILRSRETLDEPLRDALSSIFAIARSRSGLSGALHFAAGPNWRFQPIEAGNAGAGSVLV